MLNNPGTSAQLAADGQTGGRCCKLGTFDAILLDVQMPVMDGVEAIKHAALVKGVPLPADDYDDRTPLPGDERHYIAAGMDDLFVQSQFASVRYLPCWQKIIPPEHLLLQAARTLTPRNRRHCAGVCPRYSTSDQLDDLRGRPRCPVKSGR